MLSEKALEAKIRSLFEHHHRNACYPDCMDIEAAVFVGALLTALSEEGYVIEQGWRPIETAPRDFSDVLLYCPDDGLINDVCEGHFQASGYDGDERWHASLGNCVLQPSKWRPLPDPPAMISKAEEPGQ